MNCVRTYQGEEMVEATPVISGSEENKSFSKWTPSGKLELNITDETPAYGQLKAGDEFYMDITILKKD